MFLRTLLNENRRLAEAMFTLHRSGELLPNTFVIDVDTVLDNARAMKEEADREKLELYIMAKQMGRNPYICKKLVEMGYPGAVVVDFQEAMVMMRNGIPIAHAGHLVQLPEYFLERLLRYGVGMITVYSVDKAQSIDRICQRLGKVQDLCLKIIRTGDRIYSGQESGFCLEELPAVLEALEKMKGVHVKALTAFPCFLYSEESGQVENCPNLGTLLAAGEAAASRLGRRLHLNMPSCTQTQTISRIRRLGGDSAEPGSALIGTVPNNQDGSAVERIAAAYMSEVSHTQGERSYCYGGGLYPRGHIGYALTTMENGREQILRTVPPELGNIDYYFAMEGRAAVGSGVLMSFRPQMFTSRSFVMLLEGLSKGNLHMAGLYDAQGMPVVN